MNKAVTFIAQPIVKGLDTHDLTRDMHTEGKNIYIAYAPSDGTPLVADYRRISYNFVFLVALILAVPDIRPRLRLRILGIGLLILFPIHILRVVIFVLNHYGQHMKIDGVSIYPYVIRKALFHAERIFRILDGYLTPVIIWLGLLFYYRWSGAYFKRLKTAQVMD